MSKKIIVLSLTIFFLSLVFSSVNAEKTNLKLVNSYDGAKLYKAGKINVAVLHGNYRQMGRQYGKLLGLEMKLLYNDIVTHLTVNKVFPSPQNTEKILKQFALSNFEMYPQRLKKVIYGISETSGIPVDKLLVLDTFMFAVHTKVVGPPTYCSQMVAWGKYTTEGQVVAGRNLEYTALFEKFSKYFTVIVYNPTDGSNSTAIISYVGQITSANYFNSAGLVMAINDGCLEGVKKIPTDRLSPMVNNIQFMLDYSSLKAMDAAIKTNRLVYPLIAVLSSPVRSYCYEVTADDVKRRDGTDGLIVVTNHFLSPLWNKKPLSIDEQGDTSVKRYGNLLALAQKNKGKINTKKMIEMMDIPIEKGGVVDRKGRYQTLCQFVAVPKELKVYLKIFSYQEKWQEINLKSLFTKKGLVTKIKQPRKVKK